MQPDPRFPSLNGLPPDQAVRLEKTWERLAEAAPPAPPAGVPSTEEAWAALAPRLATVPRTDRQPLRARGVRRRGRWLAPLAVAALLATVGLAAGLWWAHAPAAVTVPAGAQATVVLPDGSSVEVAPGTSLSYRRGFRAFPLRAAGERSVSLEGEAYFTVVAEARPFVVQTHNAVVEVVGTSFNVRARPDEAAAATRVTVASGAVRLSDTTGGSVTIRARESAEVASGRSVAAAPAPEAVAVWREGGFAIHEQPLADVLREVERRFGIAIRGAPDLPYDLPLTLYYSRTVDAETVLHDIALAANLHYRPLRGGYDLIRRAPARR